MFATKNRLAKAQDVKRVLSRGRSLFGPHFVIKYLSGSTSLTTGEAPVRFTVTVSTKVSKRAVQRNRIKRVAREWLRLRIDEFKPGDYVISVRPAAAKLEAGELRAALEQSFQRNKLL